MTIQPYILGYGRAGRAIHEALMILMMLEKELNILSPLVLQREEKIHPSQKADLSVIFISNPPGLHTRSLLSAANAGFDAMACEKPLCISINEVETLQGLKIPTAIFHVYRQMWGPQTLKKMLSAGDFGEIISLEGRYWQASMAERSLLLPEQRPPTWKNEVGLSGPSDTLLDIGTHWIDLALFLMGEWPSKFSCDLSYANSEAPHRDSHAWLTMLFSQGSRALASISKNIHGATNHFEIHILGTKKSASWNFLHPDEIFIGSGRNRSVLTRKENAFGSRHPAFHATGWLEGYIEISRQLFFHISRISHEPYPDLQQSLGLMKMLLS